MKLRLTHPLFGRFRASISGLLGGNNFNVKTASATIGVKGTEYVTQVTNRAGTLVLVRESLVGVQGQRGPENDVRPNQVTVVINFHPSTPPAPVPPEVAQQLVRGGLGSPPPNSPNAGNFAGEKGLLRAGIVTEEDLDEGKGEGRAFGGFGGGFQFDPPNFDPNAADNAVNKGRANVIITP